MKPALFGLILGSCLPFPEEPASSPDDFEEVSPAPSVLGASAEDCDRMCQHLDDLRCREADPVYNRRRSGPAGVPNESCSESCEGNRAANPDCVALVPDCAQIDAYRQRDPESCR